MRQPTYREDVSWHAQFQNCFPYSGICAGIWLGGGDETLMAALLLCAFFPFVLTYFVRIIWRIFLGGGGGEIGPLYETLFLVRASQCV